MEDASDSFMSHVQTLLSETGNLSHQLLDLRKHFEAGNITNKVVEGTTPFPENQQSIRDGISLEFRYLVYRPKLLQGVNANENFLRNVSFKYPGNETYALRDISFKVEQGQLCVITWILYDWSHKSELTRHSYRRSFLVRTDLGKALSSSLYLDCMTPRREPSSSEDRISRHCRWKIFGAQWRSYSRTTPFSLSLYVYTAYAPFLGALTSSLID